MVDDAKAARQARLQKALSTAYLTHQISELESKVNGLSIPATKAYENVTNPPPASHPYHSHFPPLGHQPSPPPPPHSSDPFPQPPPLHFHPHDGPPQSFPVGHHGPRGGFLPQYEGPGSGTFEDEDEMRKSLGGERAWENGHRRRDEWRVIVVDVSGVMWAPKTVRRLVGQGYEVIVPLEALRALDLLKKGSNPTAIAARSAARYIEHASRNHKFISGDIMPKTAVYYKKGRGLRLQREDESRPVVDGTGVSTSGGGLAKWVHSVLSCATFFAEISNNGEVNSDGFDGNDDEPKPALYISHPPLSAEVPLGAERDEDNDGRIYAERAEGYAISQEAERFELCLEIMRDEEVELDGGHHEGRGRGRGGRRGGGRRGDGERGRGGRGRGGGRRERSDRRSASDTEQGKPQVKILLRRPVDESDDNDGEATRTGGEAGDGGIPPPLVPQLLRKPVEPAASNPNDSPVLSNPESRKSDIPNPSSLLTSGSGPYNPHEHRGYPRPPSEAFHRPGEGEIWRGRDSHDHGHRGFHRGGHDFRGGRGRGGRGHGHGRNGSGSESGHPRSGRGERGKPPRGGSFTLLQRPGPPLVTHINTNGSAMNVSSADRNLQPTMTAGEGRRVVLLQRPK